MTSLLAALAAGRERVERCELKDRMVWIKRYRRQGPRLWLRTQAFVARVCGLPVLLPSPLLDVEGMIEREVRQIATFSAAGFMTPEVVYRGPKVLVLSHLGLPVSKHMGPLRNSDAAAHDQLQVRCAAELGRLHRAGLCHGRPHPRDFIIDNGEFGFLDFEEVPASVMPLATAQARDLWLLFLQVASRAVQPETPAAAFAAWRRAAPAEASRALTEIMPLFIRFLPLARFVLRFRKGNDIIRFIAATDYLAGATRSHS
ncbi:serine/threonine protein phosphatase [Ensifer sp. ENS05]|uniref:serine/threonine protein phosphatase n=1 Tax=Ensifer sp. ENS05 TaxID=2769277 RepID=UPI001780FE26|nr:serine/threonine protein phosphatase [Ensifer sp. ENS05]MBD9592906.1 serine/threonine protein phosphatase [Ensifer sp. ENS05]